MKKFILVDNDCNAADQQHIEAGKYHMGDGDSLDKSVAAIMENGDNSPILAMLNYPGAIDAGLKMFLLHVWDLEDDGYSIVKEVEMPAITAHHKLAFAIKAVGAIYDFPAYKAWAEAWANGEARTVESVKAMEKQVDVEIAELVATEEVAYSMGLDLDVEEVSKKKAQFERAKLVFQAAEATLSAQVDQVDENIGQVFNGIEEFVDSESLTSISDEVIKVA
jgi:hypothetical protein